MAEEWIDTKEELLAAIDGEWARLHELLAGLTAAQMTEPTDGSGWNVRDHVTHLAAWERSVVFALQGEARYAGLGIDEATYRNGDYDAMNDVIMRRQRHLSPAAALAELHAVHDQLLALLAPLTDDDLFRPISAYTDSEHGARGETAAMDVIVGNTAAHYAEHTAWMCAWL